MAEIGPINLAEWYEAYGSSLVLYARQLVDPGEAQDVVQDVFVRLMAERTPPRNVKAWLFRSVRNAALSLIRSRRRRQRREADRAAQQGELFEPRPDDLADAKAAQAALQRLDGEQRELVVLRIWAGLTVQEIAHTTGLPTTTVFRRYRSALAAIRKEMQSCRNLKT